MPTTTKKSAKKNQLPKVRKSFVFTKWPILFAFIAILGAIVWATYRSMLVPTDINLVSSDIASTQKLVTDSSGCYYQQVQCVQAPCEPVRVCPANTTTSSAVPRDCISWFDGCNTCTVVDGVITGCTKMACKKDPYNPPNPYCLKYQVTTTSPVPTPTAVSSAVPSAVPSATPKQTLITISNFYASSPCGTSHFSKYTYTCGTGAKQSINNTCMSLDEAMKSAKTKCQITPESQIKL